MHGTCWMNEHDKHAWHDEHGYAGDQGAQVDEHHQRDAEFHGCLTHVIGLRVECDNTCVLLQQYDANANDVAP